MRVVTDINSPEAKFLLTAPVFSFDIETDTNNRDWSKTSKRGLSYCADMTEVGFYCGEDWALVLSAESAPIAYAANRFEQGEDGLLVEVLRNYEHTSYRFDAAQEAFIRAMFSRDDSVTAIAHNLVFDARQIFGKFELEVRDNYVYWDTRTIFKLRDGWRPAGLEVVEDDDGEVEEGTTSDNRDGAADLLSIYEMYVQKLEQGYRTFVEYMKGQRKYFPNIPLEKIPDAVITYLKSRPELEEAIAGITAWKHFKAQKTRAQIHWVLVERNPEHASDFDKMKAAEIKKVYTSLGSEYLEKRDRAIEIMMAHYVTFDIIAPFEIYRQQVVAPNDYPKYPVLLQEDLTYQDWCIEVAARGMRVDRDYAGVKLAEITAEYKRQLEAMGLTVADWDRVRKRDFITQYMFWGNRFDAEFKDQKDYAKNIKGAIAAAEQAGEKPGNAYPDTATLAAYQFTLLTKKGQLAFGKNAPISSADFSFGTKAMKDWLLLFPDMPELKNIGCISKLQGALTFLEMIMRESEYDGRAHTLIGRFADTGRNTSSAPNKQNIHFDGTDPVTDMSGIFVSDTPKSVLIELDYFNAENMSAAMISGDDNMGYACCAEDFHMARARLFFGANVMDSLTPEERTKKRKEAKTVGFGEGYGMGAKKLAVTLKATVEEAQVLLGLSAAAFPNLAIAKERARNFAEKNGWIPTWTGRRLKIPVRWFRGQKQYSSFTNGWNAPNQGGVAEIVVRAINRCRRWLRENNYKTYIVLQVHDSLIMAQYLDEYPFVVQKMIQIMGSILDDEIRYNASDEAPAITWNNSTTPATRWLVDLDNIGNSHKWGKQHNVEYPLPINEYVNRWGVHQLTDDELKTGKAPTWINSFGYGEDNLKREMAGELGIELDIPEPKPVRESFPWVILQHAVNEILPYMASRQVSGRVIDFSAAVPVMQMEFERGESTEYRDFLEKAENLMRVVGDFKTWLG